MRKLLFFSFVQIKCFKLKHFTKMFGRSFWQKNIHRLCQTVDSLKNDEWINNYFQNSFRKIEYVLIEYYPKLFFDKSMSRAVKRWTNEWQLNHQIRAEIVFCFVYSWMWGGVFWYSFLKLHPKPFQSTIYPSQGITEKLCSTFCYPFTIFNFLSVDSHKIPLNKLAE